MAPMIGPMFFLTTWQNINRIEKMIEKEVHRGDHVKFWDDVWCLKVLPLSLRVYFPRLYNINTDRRASVKEMYADGGWNLGFRRNLREENLRELDELKEMLVSLDVTADKIVCPFGKAGMFTARSMYRLITFEV